MRLAMLLPALALLAGGCIPHAAPPETYPAEAHRVPPPAYDRSVAQDPTARPRYLDQDRQPVQPQTPAWQMRPVTADAKRIETSSYTVRSGDSLRLIAVRTGAGSEAIARANNLAPPYVIQPGQRLTIPGGRYHLVREGETGIAIAQAYGVDWSRIIALNDLDQPYVLRAGMRLQIPEAGPETIEERAARFHLDLGVDDIVTGGQPALADNARPAKPVASSKGVPSPTTAIAEPAHLKGGFRWPVRGTVVKHFGPGASGERNDGIKIAVPIDTPILAAADGVVAYVGDAIPALGGLVILRHGDNWTTVYGHASQLLVQRGQAVKKGQVIALSGSSGFADRPEVHFEIREGRTPVDPEPRLATR